MFWTVSASAQGKTGIAKSVWADTIKCKHIYVATYCDSVEWTCKIIGHPMMRRLDPDLMGYQPPQQGEHSDNHDAKNMAEGIALVCVKCFHHTRQKIHYKHKE